MNNFIQMMDKQIEQSLLSTHTAYLAKAIRLEGERTTLQPLTLAKNAHGEPYLQPLVVKAPKLRGLAIREGDVCLCVVCERDISVALMGQSSLPAKRHHDLSDTVIVGVLQQDEGI